MKNLIKEEELIREESWARLSKNNYLATNLDGFYKCIENYFKTSLISFDVLKHYIVNPPILSEEEILIGGTDIDIFPVAFNIVDRTEENCTILIDYIPAYTFKEMSTFHKGL